MNRMLMAALSGLLLTACSSSGDSSNPAGNNVTNEQRALSLNVRDADYLAVKDGSQNWQMLNPQQAEHNITISDQSGLYSITQVCSGNELLLFSATLAELADYRGFCLDNFPNIAGVNYPSDAPSQFLGPVSTRTSDGLRYNATSWAFSNDRENGWIYFRDNLSTADVTALTVDFNDMTHTHMVSVISSAPPAGTSTLIGDRQAFLHIEYLTENFASLPVSNPSFPDAQQTPNPAVSIPLISLPAVLRQQPGVFIQSLVAALSDNSAASLRFATSEPLTPINLNRFPEAAGAATLSTATGATEVMIPVYQSNLPDEFSEYQYSSFLRAGNAEASTLITSVTTRAAARIDNGFIIQRIPLNAELPGLPNNIPALNQLRLDSSNVDLSNRPIGQIINASGTPEAGTALVTLSSR